MSSPTSPSASAPSPPDSSGATGVIAGPRLLRAAVFAAVCVALAAAGHVLAACAGVPWWTTVAGFAGVFLLTVPFTGRSRSLPATALALGTGQLALHTLFGLGQQHQLRLAPTADDALIRMAAKLVCGAGPASITPDDAHRLVTTAGLLPPEHGTHLDAAARPELLPSLPMLLGHLLAACATGWLLRRGDLALARLARLSARSAHEVADTAWLRPLRAALTLVRALCGALVRTPLAVTRAPRAADETPPPTAGEALQHTVIRRGPPAGRLVLAV